MRRAIIILFVLLSLSYLDRKRAKAWLRRLAVACGRKILDRLSDDYPLRLKSAVIFAPHQDDETFGCGGLIARKRNEGLPVHVVFITDGSASHPGHARLSPGEIAEIRHREAQAALKILGVESTAIHFLDEPDGTLRELDAARRGPLVARIAELLREIRPDEIFLPCNPDGSSEHDAAFSFVIEAVQSAQLQPEVWQYPVWTWWNPFLLFRRVFNGGCCRVPTEDYRPIKHRAVACYRSQIEPLAPSSEPSLPGGLVKLFNSEVEYFFRFDLPVRREKAPTAAAVIK